MHVVEARGETALALNWISAERVALPGAGNIFADPGDRHPTPRIDPHCVGFALKQLSPRLRRCTKTIYIC
jgi:hypothetical protein